MEDNERKPVLVVPPLVPLAVLDWTVKLCGHIHKSQLVKMEMAQNTLCSELGEENLHQCSIKFVKI